MSYYAAKLAQIKQAGVTRDDMRLLKRAIKLLKENAVELKYQKLELNTASLAVYTDAGFVTNADMTSQLGFIVLMTDASKRCVVLHWNS